MSPQPDRIVVLLVEGDPGEGHLCFFYLTPVSQERRLPVACRGAYDSYLEVQGVAEDFEQPATHQLLRTRQRRPQLGPEYDPGRISARIARGVNDSLLSQRRFLVPRTPTIRPMGTITASPRCWDKGLYASDLTTRDGCNRSDAHLLIFPILSRNLMGFDNLILSHKRQQSRILNMPTSENRNPRFTGKLCCHSNEECIHDCSRPAQTEHHKCLRAAILLRVRLREKSLGETLHWSDESPPAMRVDCRI